MNTWYSNKGIQRIRETKNEQLQKTPKTTREPRPVHSNWHTFAQSATSTQHCVAAHSFAYSLWNPLQYTSHRVMVQLDMHREEKHRYLALNLALKLYLHIHRHRFILAYLDCLQASFYSRIFRLFAWEANWIWPAWITKLAVRRSKLAIGDVQWRKRS